MAAGDVEMTPLCISLIVYSSTVHLNMPKNQTDSPIWSVKSMVVRGQQQGRVIGFPTANLDTKLVDSLLEAVKPGVFATLVRWRDIELLGATYYGPRSNQSQEIDSVQNKNILEVHILDFDQVVYGQELSIFAFKYIRPPLKFNSLADLKAQIAKDVKQVRAWYIGYLKS